MDKSGSIGMGEWAAFAKGGRWTSPHHHQGHVQNTGWGMQKAVDKNKPDLVPPELMPHYSDKKVVRKHIDDEPQGLDELHLVLWHLSQEVSNEKTGCGVAHHPAHVSFHDMFKKLNIEHNNRVTREDWALVLRRHIGVGAHVTDAHLAAIFDEMDGDHSGGISFAEFAAYCRGAATPIHARGMGHMVEQEHKKQEAAKAAKAAAAAPAPAAA